MPRKFHKQKRSKIENHIICYDLETSALSPEKAQPLEIAAIIIDINTLEEKEDGVFGPILVKPHNNDWSEVEKSALDKNGLIREEVEEKGLEQEVAFREFVNFVQKFQKTNSKWDALVSSGYNIKGYDNIIMNRLAKQYNHIDKDGFPILFHPFHSFDLIDLVRPWFYSTNTLESFSLENLSSFMGLDTSQSHTALDDTRRTAKMLKRFLKFYQKLSPKYLDKFEGCFKNEK